MPASHADFHTYMNEMIASDDLFVTDAARELGIQIVLHPPVPLATRPLLELANFVTVGLLPAPIRRAYRLSWDPARELALRSGAECAKRFVLPLLPARLRLISSARTATATLSYVAAVSEIAHARRIAARGRRGIRLAAVHGEGPAHR